ncbi:MAG: cell division protein SepF [Clostridiales bacterium]|nr:cell division protein SepF [Clostridiales bacterium]
MGKLMDWASKLFDYEEDYSDEEYYDGEYAPVEEYNSNEFNQPVSAYADYEDVPYQAEPQTVYQQPVAVATPVPASSATVIMLTPYDIRTSQVVCDHIREGHIVICNLTPNANNQRVVDYISGAVYALDGKIEPTPVKTTFVCTPKNVDLIVDSASAEESGTKVSAL